MLVKDIMTVDVVTVSPDDTLFHLIQLLEKYHYHIVPVADDKHRLVGVVNYKDIMKVFVPHNPALEKLLKSTHFYPLEEEDILETDLPQNLVTEIKMADIMNTDVVSVEDDSSISYVRNTMRVHNIIRMPVTRDSRLVGFITLFDIILALFRKRGLLK